MSKVTFSKKALKLTKAELFQQQAGPVCFSQNVQTSVSTVDNNFIFSVEFYSRRKTLSQNKTQIDFCQQPVFTGYKSHILVGYDVKRHTSLLVN